MIGMEIDKDGLISLKQMRRPVVYKSLKKLGEIIGHAVVPFILKRVMRVTDAKMVVDASVRTGGEILKMPVLGADAVIVV